MKVRCKKSSNITCVINVLTCFRTRPEIIAKKFLKLTTIPKSTFFVHFMNDFFHTESMEEFCNLTKFEWSVFTRTPLKAYSELGGFFNFRYNRSFIVIIDPPLGEFVEILPSVMIFPGNIITRVIFRRIPLAPGL